jgi:hypothetical protein
MAIEKRPRGLTRDLALAEFRQRQYFLLWTKICSRGLYVAIYVTFSLISPDVKSGIYLLTFGAFLLSVVWLIEGEAQRDAILLIERSLSQYEERHSSSDWDEEYIRLGYFKRYSVAQIALRISSNIEPLLWFLPLGLSLYVTTFRIAKF